jgi:hypothetical protein
MENIYQYRLSSLQHHQNCLMLSAAIAEKSVMQGVGAHAESMGCHAVLCAENAMVQAVQTHSHQILLMTMTMTNLTMLMDLLSRVIMHLQ